MKTQKMSFEDIKDVLSRDEMRAIMAGSDGDPTCSNCCKDAYNNVLGYLKPPNCNTALADCKASWPNTVTSVCYCN